MACALTQDINLDCKDSIGGLEEAYAIELENIVSITETAGVVTAITKAATKKFHRYKLTRETCSAASPLTANAQNGSLFATHNLKLVFNKMQSATRSEILLMAKNRLVFVVKDRNGKFWLMGKTAGLDLTQAQDGTGTQAGDRNGYELDFTGTEPESMVEVNSTVATDLMTAGL